jgi:hypothetical protein
MILNRHPRVKSARQEKEERRGLARLLGSCHFPSLAVAPTGRLHIATTDDVNADLQYIE